MKIQFEHYGRKVSIEETDDMTIFELYDMFKTIALAMTFTNDQIDNAIINIASELSEDK